MPLLARLGFDELVRDAGYPGSQMVPADAALISFLTLKLLDKERRSHIDDFNFEEAAGVFAGLNVLPKKSFATAYSYRTGREHQERLLAGWVRRLCAAAVTRGEGLLAGPPSHPLPRRRGRPGEPLHPRSRHGSPERAVVLRPGSRPPGALLCQRQPDARRAARRGPAVRRILARPGRPRPRVVVLRLEADDLCGAVAPEPAGGPLRHHPPSRGEPGPEDPRAARGRLDEGRDRYPQAPPEAGEIPRGVGPAPRLRGRGAADRGDWAWGARTRRCS